MKEDRVNIDVTITSPGALIEAGSEFTATLVVGSRVSDDTWEIDIPLIVEGYDKIDITMNSESSDYENKLLSDGNYQFILDISNQGNRDITLQPIQRELPGGWTLSSIEEITIGKGQQSQWDMSITGNGKATSGILEIRFISDYDFSIDWNVTLDVISGAIPVVDFYQVDIPNGQTADTPLGVDTHPVGAPGFDLGWTVTNNGTVSWEPSVTMELPNSDFSSSCSLNPQKIFPGESSRVWCTVIIPMSAEAGSEPEITLVMEDGGIETRNTISLLVETVNQVTWTLIQVSDIYAGSSSTMYFELQNTGNSVISDRIIVSGPSSWNIRVLDGMMVNLQPDEIRSVQIEFTPNNAKDSTIILNLGESTESSDYSKQIPIEVKGIVTDDSFSSTLILVLSIIIISIMGGGLYFYQQEIQKKKNLNPNDQKKKEDVIITSEFKNTENLEKSQNNSKNLEKYDEYPGWLWDSDKETWIPDPEHQDIQ